jgi:zinc-ribbon domain
VDCIKEGDIMFHEKLAIAIKVNGKVLRELEDSVHLPFGSEYTILIKNLNTIKACVLILVDGIDILSGSGIIVNANSLVELTRYVSSTSMETGNALKFIERISSIEDNRGIKVDDGLMRVEFTFEQPIAESTNTFHIYQEIFKQSKYIPYTSPWPPAISAPYWVQSPTSVPSWDVTCNTGTTSPITNSILRGNINPTSAISTAGITVPGSSTTQQFHTASGFVSDGNKRVMILKMIGIKADAEIVSTPVTVNQKAKCITCGKSNRATYKFCSNCGTALVIL